MYSPLGDKFNYSHDAYICFDVVFLYENMRLLVISCVPSTLAPPGEGGGPPLMHCEPLLHHCSHSETGADLGQDVRRSHRQLLQRQHYPRHSANRYVHTSLGVLTFAVCLCVSPPVAHFQGEKSAVGMRV